MAGYCDAWDGWLQTVSSGLLLGVRVGTWEQGGKRGGGFGRLWVAYQDTEDGMALCVIVSMSFSWLPLAVSL
jgi:hypothetical protein